MRTPTPVAAILCLLVPAAAQSILIVPRDQPTIQAGIDAVQNGDTVIVMAGTYSEHIDFNGKLINVVGAGGPQGTILDGGLTKPVVTFKNQETRKAVLMGFTIRRGLGLPNSRAAGAGIRIVASSPTIRGCWIVDNICGFAGGGIGTSDQDEGLPPRLVGAASPLVEGCLIARNIAGTAAGASDASGGGLAFVGFDITAQGGRAEVRRCQIVDNEANGLGGGLFARYNHNVIVDDCLFARNRTLGTAATAGGGGVGMAYGAVCLLRNNRICRNTSRSDGGGVKFVNVTGAELVNDTIADNQGGGLAGYAYKHDFGLDVRAGVVNCILWNNGTSEVSLAGADRNNKPPAVSVAYSDVRGGYTGTGNIAADPMLLNRGSGNHRLAPGSPCLDKGDNAAANLPAGDFEGDLRVLNGTVDIGADERNPAAAFHFADAATLSLAAGGTIRYSLQAAGLGGAVFLTLPGLGGTLPGSNLGVVTLPLNVDNGTWILLGSFPSAFAGLLDGGGGAATSLVLPPGLPPVLKGYALATAAILIDPASFAIKAVTNGESVDFIP